MKCHNPKQHDRLLKIPFHSWKRCGFIMITSYSTRFPISFCGEPDECSGQVLQYRIFLMTFLKSNNHNHFDADNCVTLFSVHNLTTSMGENLSCFSIISLPIFLSLALFILYHFQSADSCCLVLHYQ